MPKPSQIYTTYEARYYYLLDEGYSEDEAEDLAIDEEAFDLEIMEYDDTYNINHLNYDFISSSDEFKDRINRILKDLNYLISSNNVNDLYFENRLNYYLNKNYNAEQATKLAILEPKLSEYNIQDIIQKASELVKDITKNRKISKEQRLKIINELSQKLEQLKELLELFGEASKIKSHKEKNFQQSDEKENLFIFFLMCFIIVLLIVSVIFD